MDAYDCVISNNVASTSGGGFFDALASRCVISSNCATANNGGGLAQGILTNQCVVINNVCGGYGGGASDTEAYDTVFSNNVSGQQGGGLAKTVSSIITRSANCLFADNRSASYGGGQSKGITVDCVFSNNVAMVRGGAANELVATNCFFIGNVATNGDGRGGALYTGSAANCRFISNVAKQGGGAYRSVLVNSLLARNHALEYSGAVHGTTAVLLNCTVANNSVEGTRGGAFDAAEIIATNCIVWANIQLSDGATNNWGYDSRVRFAHCLISPLPTGGTDGGGNIAVNPRFVDEGGGDYRLRASSPCVNAGMNLDWMVGAVDLDGQPRIFPPDGLVDLGAFERIPGNTATILTLR